MLSRCVNSLLLASLVMAAAAANALDTGEDLRLYGFVNQGLVYTTDNRFFGDSEDVSLNFHDLGLGANWQPLPRLQLSGQFLYRQAGETSRDAAFIDYAFVDWRAFQGLESQAGLRAGRIKNIYALHNDTRDIAAARPSVLLPSAIYLDKWRDIIHTSDSFSLYGSTYLGEHFLSLDLLYGKPFFSDQAEREIIVKPLSGSIEEARIQLGRLLLEAFGGRARAALSLARVNWDYQPDPGTRSIPLGPGMVIDIPLNGYPGETQIDLQTLSLEFNHGAWQLTTELNRMDYELADILQPGSARTTEIAGYYAALAYQFTPRWKGFVRRDTLYLDNDDKKGEQSAAATGLPAHNFYAHDTTLGVTYEHDSHWHLGLEYHRVKGTAWLSASENDLSDTHRDWQMLVAQISYRF